MCQSLKSFCFAMKKLFFSSFQYLESIFHDDVIRVIVCVNPIFFSSISELLRLKRSNVISQKHLIVAHVQTMLSKKKKTIKNVLSSKSSAAHSSMDIWVCASLFGRLVSVLSLHFVSNTGTWWLCILLHELKRCMHNFRPLCVCVPCASHWAHSELTIKCHTATFAAYKLLYMRNCLAKKAMPSILVGQKHGINFTWQWVFHKLSSNFKWLLRCPFILKFAFNRLHINYFVNSYNWIEFN